MESNISPIQIFNPSSETCKDEEESSFTSQPMERTSNRYTSSITDVEGYQWVVNTSNVANIEGQEDQMCGSGGAHSPGTLEAAPPQEETTTRISGPWASFQKPAGGRTERSARRARRTAESVKRYLKEEDDGNILLKTFVSNAEPPFGTLFGKLERLGLASPTPPTPPTPPAKQDYMVAIILASREIPQHRETEQSLEEILYLPSCG